MRYDFRCSDCDAMFELTRPMEEASLPAKCPGCGGAGQRHYSIPGMIVRGSTSKNRDPKDYRHLMPVPAAFSDMTPSQYERMHGSNFAANERLASEIAHERSVAGCPDGAIRKVGQMSFQEYLAMKHDHPAEFSGDNATPSRELLERRGCIFKHEVGQGKKDA